MQKNKTNQMTSIAIGVGILFTGGWAILMFSRLLPFPGGKYLAMSPYISLVIYVLQNKVPGTFTPFAFSLVFALLMLIINVFMGMAIFLTGILTSIPLIFIRSNERRARVAGILYSSFTLLTALLVSKYAIGGVFLNIPDWWIGICVILGGILGTFGIIAGNRVLKSLKS